MKVGLRQKSPLPKWKVLALLLMPLLATAADREGRSVEADNTGTTITLDDDLFSAPGRDRDYTGGFALSFSGSGAARVPVSVDPLLAKLDRWVGADADARQTTHALTAGVIAFTPGDIASASPVLNDRPYASLVFLSNARRYVGDGGGAVYNTRLVVGLMGLDLVGTGHRAIHKLASSDPIRGYSHQISSGGEPTLRYTVARQAPLGRASTYADFKWTAAASVGTVTESSLALSGRWGRIRSPWWSFTPEQNLYMQEAQPLTPFAGPETFFTTGARVKARAYNAFLQGQFRHSEVRLSSNQVEPLLLEAWAGIVMRQASGLEIRYLARWGSPELRDGPGARDLLWGSIEFAINMP